MVLCFWQRSILQLCIAYIYMYIYIHTYIYYVCNRAIYAYINVYIYIYIFTHLQWMLLQPLCSWPVYSPACAFEEVPLNKWGQPRNRRIWSEYFWYNPRRNVLRNTNPSRQICAYKNEEFFSSLPAAAILHNTQGCQET